MRLVRFFTLFLVLLTALCSPQAQASDQDLVRALWAKAEASAVRALALGHDDTIYDATGAQPDYVATRGLAQLSLLTGFASGDQESAQKGIGLGRITSQKGAAKRLKVFLMKRGLGATERSLLNNLESASEKLGLPLDQVVYELSNACLGRFPGQEPFVETALLAAEEYLDSLGLSRDKRGGGYDLIPVSGRRAAFELVINSLRNNRLLKDGDALALPYPLPPSYLAAPSLQGLVRVQLKLKKKKDNGWYLPEDQIGKLDDKKVKMVLFTRAFPAGEGFSPKTVEKIRKRLWRANRHALMLNDLSATLLAERPTGYDDRYTEKSLTIYSFAPYIGSTGQGLALVAVPKLSKVDWALTRRPEEHKDQTAGLYSGLTKYPRQAGFAARLIMDAAAPGGALLPARDQALLALVCLNQINRSAPQYRQALQDMLKARWKAFHNGLGVAAPEGGRQVRLNTLVDLGAYAQARYGAEFAAFFKKQNSVEFFSRLAGQKRTICLPGPSTKDGGLSIWVCLNAFDEKAAALCGRNIRAVVRDYYLKWNPPTHQNLLAKASHLDNELFRFINQGYNSAFLDKVMPWVSNIFPLVPILLFVLWLVFKKGRPGLFMLLAFGLMFLLSDMMVSQFWRPYLGRLAPYATLEGAHYFTGSDWVNLSAQAISDMGERFSLPSAHASNSMAAAAFVWVFRPYLGLGFAFIAVLVAYSRIYLGVHFPGDILFGFVWGSLVGLFFGKAVKIFLAWMEKHRPAWLKKGAAKNSLPLP